MNNTELAHTSFLQSDLSRMELLKTPLKGVDLRTCTIEGIRLSGEELRGCIVTESQAIQLARFLGLVIE